MLEVFNKRCSIRKYHDKVVEDEKLQEVLHAIQSAPTWKNKQCFEVIVVDDRQTLEKLGALVRYNPSESAYTMCSHNLVFIARPDSSGLRDEKPYYMADTAIAITHASLEATNQGLGTCWVGVFPEEEVKTLLNIPETYKVVALMPLGYANEPYAKRPRREIDAIVHHNTY
ncbi:nitroreductase [Breznakia blatticola]|uniref:Nitroreductase n=1 Tax=Breznakia blatticola TaxID=1754012 RepID=A0A4R8A363_9FIRM|nr:nitroreductase family protein [Breznakia blatticola]TDW24695.1 nitroreductase [Breznakia blatticola]